MSCIRSVAYLPQHPRLFVVEREERGRESMEAAVTANVQGPVLELIIRHKNRP